jgi:hypothetical protein
MKQYLKIVLLLVILVPAYGQVIRAQGNLLKKMQERAEDEVVRGVFGDKKKSGDPGTTTQPGYEQTSSETSLSNTRGGGLTNTPPNVPENIASAGSAFGKGNYRDAKNAVRQAILGVEMEIGHNILESLPESVKGLVKVPEEDRVASMSIGFVGLTIERTYRGGDQQLKVTIGNDAALLSAVNMYMTSGVYTSSEETGQKQVTFKGEPGILSYDESSGYTLSVPFGQSSVFVAEGVNYSNEQEIMAAAEEFDLEKIKKELGEQ